jgi:hypothetical protein
MSSNNYTFAVDERCYCVWDPELQDENSRFLARVDAAYFEYAALSHVSQLDVENRPKAALALRAAYHHGLETLFSLIAAAIQAPNAVVAWLPRCQNETLRDIVAKISRGDRLLTPSGRQFTTWDRVSSAVHRNAFAGDVPPGKTAELFARLWTRLAGDLTSDLVTAEYNSIKHGLRVTSGAFALAVGIEREPGAPASASEMDTIVSTEGGNSFLAVEPIQISRQKASPHLSLRRVRVNWSPETMAELLVLISMSISNVLSALRIANRTLPTEVKFLRPTEESAFDAPLRRLQPVPTFVSGPVFTEEDRAYLATVSRDDLKADLENRGARDDVAKDTP